MGDYTPQPPVSQGSVPSADSVPVSSPTHESTPVDPNRPVSTIPADSVATPATPSADLSPASESVMSGSSVLTHSDSPADPTATVSATPVVPIPEPIQSADETPPVPPITIDVRTQTQPNPIQSEPPADSSSSPVLPQSPQEPQAPVPPDLSVSSPPGPIKQGIKDASGVQEPSSVQSIPSEPAPGPTEIQQPEAQSKSAGINPEPPQASQEAPSADSQPTAEPKQSFGDLISEPKPPPVSDQAPKTQSPTIPPAPPPAPEAVQPLPDLSIPTIPPVAQPPEKLVSVGTGAPDLSEKRNQAIQARKQRVADHLDRIIAFVGQKGKVNNQDIRDLLHVSQTTVSDYCHTLVSSGKLKREGKAKATMYSLP